MLTLGFDPFVQQLLILRVHVVSEPATGISINAAKSFYYMDTAMHYPDMDAVMVASMLEDIQQPQATSASGLESYYLYKRFNDTSQPLSSALRPACPSGNCVWKPYQAIDVCTQCRTTMAEMQLTTSSQNASNPIKNVLGQVGHSFKANADISLVWDLVPENGYSWQIPNEISATTFIHPANGVVVNAEASAFRKVIWPLNFVSIGVDNLPGWKPGTFANIIDPIAAIGFAEFDMRSDGTPSLVQSLECALTYCVKEFNRSVTQGALVTNVLSERYGTVGWDQSGADGPLGYLNWSVVIDDKKYASPNTEVSGIMTLLDYLLGNSTHSASLSGMYPFIGETDNLDLSNSTGMIPPEYIINSTRQFADSAASYQALHNQSWEGIDLTEDFTTVLQNMDAVMSDVIQQYGGVFIAGDNAVTKTFVSVRWPWIVLPAICVLVGMIVLGLTIWKTARVNAPKWGSSLLPLMYRYKGIDWRGNQDKNMEDPIIQPDASQNTKTWTAPTFETSNKLSRFELEAEVTKAHFTMATAVDNLWTLRALELCQPHRNIATRRIVYPWQRGKRGGLGRGS